MSGGAVAKGCVRAWRALARVPQALLLGGLQVYRYTLSPWLGSSCRFEPTCSRYAQQAITAHGAAAGSYLAARRLLRCHPWCAGGHDPVPPAGALFSHFTQKNSVQE
jgi:putative membrane protein insertion efficiency factor